MAAALLRRQCNGSIFDADAPRRRPLSREKRLQPLRIAASRDEISHAVGQRPGEFSNFAKNVATHETTVNSNEILGRAAAKTLKFKSKLNKNPTLETASKFQCFFEVLGTIFDHF